MKILILTDHLTHSSANSFYLIANSLYAHPVISGVDIATRSVEENSPFFRGEQLILSVRTMSEFIDYDHFDRWINENKRTITSLEDYDYILLRLPRPIHTSFFSFLGQCFDEKHIINRPSGIVKTGNKAFLMSLKEHTVPIALLYSMEDIIKFADLFPIVLKPLEDYGGKGLIKIEGDRILVGDQKEVSFDEFKNIYARNPIPYLGMKYLKNVKNGDKRIVVVNGKILASSLRFPAEGSWLCNVAQGGSAEISQTTAEENEIVQLIHPILKKEGIFMFGLDTLEDDTGKRVISEINTLSVGGLAPSAELSGKDLGGEYAEQFVKFIQSIKDNGAETH